MKHLNDAELIDALDDGLGPAGQHSAQCDACRAKLAALREAIARVDAVDVPEPSPLFWDHFSRPGSRRDRRPGAGSRRGGALAGVARGLDGGGGDDGRGRSSAASGNGRRRRDDPRTTPCPDDAALRRRRPTRRPSTERRPRRHRRDQAWAVVRTVADDVEWDDDAVTAGLVARPGWAERAAQTLTPDERDAAARAPAGRDRGGTEAARSVEPVARRRTSRERTEQERERAQRVSHAIGARRRSGDRERV